MQPPTLRILLRPALCTHLREGAHTLKTELYLSTGEAPGFGGLGLQGSRISCVWRFLL